MGKSFNGSIYRLSGNRRRPWAVAKTFGWDDKGKQIKKIIGYAESKKDGLQMLMEYNQNPLSSADLIILTFEDAFNRWINYAEISEANRKIYRSVFDNHCKDLYKIRILELKTLDIQNCIDKCSKGFNTKRYIKLIASQIYKYCTVQLDMTISKNFSIGLKVGEKPISELHTPFSHAEVKLLWENITLSYIDSVILSLTTEGIP